ncbi:MAG: hypothetical protein RR357_03575 [Clostridia bacterium]
MSTKGDSLKLLKLTLNYTNSKFWYLLLVSLIPSVSIAFVVSPYSSLDFLCTYFSQNVSSFSVIYKSILGIKTSTFWIGIIGVVLVPIAFSILIGTVERHMRMGEFTLGVSRLRVRINYNFLTSLKFLLVLLLIFQIGKFLQGIMFFAFAKFFTETVAFVFSIVWYILIFILEWFVLSLIILWMPTMLQTGLSSTKAFGLSVRQVMRHVLSIMLTMLVPTLPMVLFMIANALLGLKIGLILDSIILSITFVYYIVLMYSVFYDVNGIEREDLKKVDIWKKSF